MDELVRHMPWAKNDGEREALLTREWLVTNGLGGYASGTVAGVATRRYHGLLIAALPNPLGRRGMFNHLWEQLRRPAGSALPVWRAALVGDFVMESQGLLPHLQNTVHVTSRLLAGEGKVRLKLVPSI